MLLFDAHLSEYFPTTFCNILEKEVSNLRVRRMNLNLVLKFFILENEFFKLLWALQFGVQFLIGARDFPHLQNV